MTDPGALALEPSLSARQIASAIEHDEFELYYQPLVDMSDASLFGIEALIRWNHPQRGVLSPAEFIPLAEESGLIVPIGAWALRQACTDYRQLQPTGDNLLLSVNVSSRQLDEPNFLTELADILRQTRMPAHLLQLEITEGIFLRDSLRVGALFNAMRALGIKIAFDDFGTGYSSLSYIERFPVDTLKVDQSFVEHIGDRHVSNEIVHLIIHLATTVGMSVTAEGVESPEQAAALMDIGCNIAQGFLYSHPLPLNSIMKLLQPPSLEPLPSHGSKMPSRCAPAWIPLVPRYAIP
jgi:EAL domain-containing protein (putative c-di-GMP-specific phosphodiesterase class I)